MVVHQTLLSYAVATVSIKLNFKAFSFAVQASFNNFSLQLLIMHFQSEHILIQVKELSSSDLQCLHVLML